MYNMAMFKAPVYGTYQYPAWSITMGWIFAIIPGLPIPYFVVKHIIINQGSVIQVRSIYDRVAQYYYIRPQ